jgi:hypothetical protein
MRIILIIIAVIVAISCKNVNNKETIVKQSDVVATQINYEEKTELQQTDEITNNKVIEKQFDSIVAEQINEIINTNNEYIEYTFIRPDSIDGNETFYDNYKIIDPVENEAWSWSLMINQNIYKTNAILDSGTLQLLIYKYQDRKIALIGLVDYYGSVYFVYYYNEKTLSELGTIHIDQPNVEDVGFKETSFRIYEKDNKLFINSYLGEQFHDGVKYNLPD